MSNKTKKIGKRKYYEFYLKSMETGSIPYESGPETDGGLCSVFPRAMEIFKPTSDDVRNYDIGFGGSCYWGSDMHENSDEAAIDFSTLRQTIVLFLAAMNNEL